jgi:hypothetical protein
MAKPTQVVFDRWDSYVSESNGKPVFVSFDVDAAENDLTDSLTQCARVMIPIQKPNHNGGPVKPESDQLYEMEDELCAGLAKHRVPCRLVGRITFDGIRQLVFQLDDWDSFRPPVGLWMGEHEDYQIDVSEHDGWGFFDDCVRPTPDVWLYIADRRVVQNLLDAGSDAAKPHGLEYVFNGEAGGLRKLAAALRERGYTPLGKPDFASGQVILVKRLPLDVDAICEESRANRDAAEEHGVECDGWGAEVVK